MPRARTLPIRPAEAIPPGALVVRFVVEGRPTPWFRFELPESHHARVRRQPRAWHSFGRVRMSARTSGTKCPVGPPPQFQTAE